MAPRGGYDRAMSILTAWKRWIGQETPADRTRWHPWMPTLPVRLNDGATCIHECERRWNGSRWEYRASPETHEDYKASLW